MHFSFLQTFKSRHGPGACVTWDPSREAEGTDLRQFDWVVFGLVDRPEFDLRHMRCPFLSGRKESRAQDASLQANGRVSIAGGGHGNTSIDGKSHVLEIDAMIVTDRELMYELDPSALSRILRAPWASGLPRLSLSRAITVAWILEPPVISTAPYERVLSQPQAFDLVFSHHEDMLAQLPDGRGRYVPLATSLIPPHQRRIHTKTKLVSILASARAHAPGHQLRHAIVSQLGWRAAGRGSEGEGAHVLEAFGQAADGQVSLPAHIQLFTHTHRKMPVPRRLLALAAGGWQVVGVGSRRSARLGAPPAAVLASTNRRTPPPPACPEFRNRPRLGIHHSH